MTFSEKLYQLRRQKGMSQEELADRLEVSRQAVSRWEMGTTLPDAKNLLQLSEIFGVSIDYLLKDDMTEDRKEPSFRQFEAPAPKPDFFHSERNRQIGLIVLVMLQVLPLFIGLFSSFFTGSRISLILSSALHLLNIVVFEIVFHICGDERGRYYRRKYYRITVWLFTWCPVRALVWLIVSPGVFGAVQVWMVELAAALVSLLICITVTLLLREKKQKQ